MLLPMKYQLPILVGLFLLLGAGFVHAQEENVASVALPVALIDIAESQEGDIICFVARGFSRCSDDYAQSMYGVVTASPAASLETDASAVARLIVLSGESLVRVSGANGAIAEGDFITSSTTPGVGQKALQNGYILGVALGSFEDT